ncbi:response regulator transcription factor [Fusibacter ferrireducens]|uniref:Stage 0 sporulation protein A homolog n=1 Tax=Fusibacter ferrireducens TaxID=2785058 RepID=A0ABR9ZYC9_9FIRM|nr:response regulator transcription factor [Fusibacter ferrireducens]MBF4694579.1 response regulator transcription factor [Fusibacter ferrireducens]
MEKILIVEDDLQIQTLIRDYVNASGYIAVTASDGEEALQKFESEKPNLALLDIIVPKIDGFEVCRKIRNESNIPIIMLSSKKEDTDKILALGLGADDYIEKPFSPRVLVAKIQSQFRRVNELSGTPVSDTLKIRDLEIDIKARTVTVKGIDIPFSVKEFEILNFLMANKNQALSREKIFDEIWGYNEYGDINTVTVHVRKIREKIENNPSEPEYIETVWGIGYKFKG